MVRNLHPPPNNFVKKSSVLEEILGLVSGSPPDDQGGFTCMPHFYKVIIDKSVIYYHSNLCTGHNLCVLT